MTRLPLTKRPLDAHELAVLRLLADGIARPAVNVVLAVEPVEQDAMRRALLRLVRGGAVLQTDLGRTVRHVQGAVPLRHLVHSALAGWAGSKGAGFAALTLANGQRVYAAILDAMVAEIGLRAASPPCELCGGSGVFELNEPTRCPRGCCSLDTVLEDVCLPNGIEPPERPGLLLPGRVARKPAALLQAVAEIARGGSSW